MKRLLLRFCCLIFVFGLCSQLTFAQFYPTQYRPTNQQWQQLETTHFKLVYPKGNDSTAVHMGRILEDQYQPTKQLVNGRLKEFPIILNDYNDRSNGFVTSFHFRSEIELPPIKGKALNPQTGNWLQNVGPHELVHALQLSNLGQYNIPWLVSLFSPDLARSFHGAIPSGVTEGLAVYHESNNISPNGGRGNYPFFTNQFNAIFNSPDRWSMGQVLQNPSATRPFNRHYIGGYEFTAWVQETYGEETSRKALNFYMNFPFLGYGMALRRVTGHWPAQLYSQFEKEHLPKEEQSPQIQLQKIDLPFDGQNIRRPKWLSDSTLIFYGSFYNTRPGFYHYDLETDKLKRLITSNSVSDFRYDLSADRSSMVYSFYESDARYNNTYKAELAEYHFNANEHQSITKHRRLYAPIYAGKNIWALQTRPASSALVSIHQDSVQQLLSLGDDQIVAAESHPSSDKLAIIANKNGDQALWITRPNNLDAVSHQQPDISFQNGSIFDPVWHPSTEKILFSSDFSGTLQLYEYDLSKEKIIRLTHSPYNAFEGAYSPDGEKIVYIRQEGNERLPVIMKRPTAYAADISPSSWQTTGASTSNDQPTVSDSIITASNQWTTGSYSSGIDWLKPRTMLPAISEVSGSDRYQLGFSMHSNNLLQNQAYSAEASYLDERIWYDISYQSKQFFPGFKMRLYSEPSYFNVTADDLNNPLRILRQDRSASLSVPINLKLNQNIFSTSFFIEPEFRFSQLRFLDAEKKARTSKFANSAVSNIYAQFNYRLQQNIRDVQPNSGLILYSELEHFWTSSDLQLSTPQHQINLSLQQPTGLKGGAIAFFSPLRRWNQSLKLQIEGLSQSGFIFDNQSLVSDGFSEPVLPSSKNLLSLNASYAVPLLFADNGGFLLPLYLDNIHLIGFSNTVTNPASSNWYEQSRTVVGLELRTQFRISNLSFNIGIGWGYEPTRTQHQIFVGDF